MNSLTKTFRQQIEEAEKQGLFGENSGRYRLGHHLMPPVGWLNDPNGLCWFQGKYHVFFQYSPFSVEGGLKFWGHYTSEDMLSWKYEGVPLYPDAPYDCHGVYSGSALADQEKLHLFYTGNIKLSGTYDYINNGRESNTVYANSEDGIHFGAKQEIIHCDRYPADFTCHIRDPKVWKDVDKYYMVLGGRLKSDQGAVLLYQSQDLKNWKYEKTVTTENSFGYMWECPDFFELSGEKILSVSPQGLTREEYRFQNIYQSGYFVMKPDGSVDENDFREWDMGFDFYAPQTFEDNKGRRILIGWMGMPDADAEYRNLTVTEGWQHCLTVPRSLSFQDGIVYQNPVEELIQLRKEKKNLDEKNPQVIAEGAFDMELSTQGSSLEINLGDNLKFVYSDGMAELLPGNDAGAGRKVRKARIDYVKKVRILADVSAVEVYLNDGEMVFSTRYYPADVKQTVQVKAEKFTGNIWALDKMSFTK